MLAAGNETGKMRHVNHEKGTDRIGDIPEPGEIKGPAVRGTARDNDFRMVLLRKFIDLVHVDHAVLLAHTVLHGVEPFAGKVWFGTVGQVAAGVQTEPEYGVSWFGQGQEYGLVGLTSGTGLDVGMIAVE